MRAIDTNVVVRYLTGDDPEQARRARALIDRNAIFVPRTVILECEWVLRRAYGLPKKDVTSALRQFAGLPDVTLEDAEIVARALDWASEGMDFADALHLSAAQTCSGLKTFDRAFIRAAKKEGIPGVTAP
ncbi:type II toxin-antitoxin system VapC family toxin [Komagataeibacter intermedius]|uniref:type II toxin-antitoxin system VapC family toxin n=1 Tax=Acetobacteraceae TaxID=433 RepID=UPI00094F974B|nr:MULTISPECIES: type II toxin-antitoxin system VapC family toxin [Acetobacteraceae]MCF3636119.1 type II toxin-antitoxin system VapC family toxin [Komagataeibacter intermedius]WEQ54962.1 type II toxin-antitoxin system VapC family toxin [Komagataeibacter nataicola]